jgi:hypothetical protein
VIFNCEPIAKNLKTLAAKLLLILLSTIGVHRSKKYVGGFSE